MNEISTQNTVQLYEEVRQILHAARHKVYQTANGSPVLPNKQRETTNPDLPPKVSF